MTVAYFDCFSGISGDMILGALVDAGVDFETLREHLRKLPVDGYRIERRIVKKHEIAGVKIDVLIETVHGVEVIEGPGTDRPVHETANHAHAHSDRHTHHKREHTHDHDHHDHPHGHGHLHENHGDHGGACHLQDLIGLIEDSALDADIRQRAIRIFDRLAEAEGTIHGVPRDQVHLHEVSGKDAVIDIVGACIGLHLLGIDEVYASPLPVGTGFIRCAHGRMPVPAPGALELLRGVPIYQTNTQGELVTPTGAAFLKTVVRAFGPMPAMALQRVGYGAGAKDFAEHPNLLRVCIGDKIRMKDEG